MISRSNFRIALVALLVITVDQLTKYWVNQHFLGGDERVVIPGFFRLVHWSNTGAAWSLFMGKNKWLAVIAVVALVILYRSRHHFEAHTVPGQLALGLIFGGIIGNLLDRLFIGHVTDFLYFYMERRGAPELGFPAFNIADSAICIGVTLVFLMSWRKEKYAATPAQPAA